jgi:hypothetical protein
VQCVHRFPHVPLDRSKTPTITASVVSFCFVTFVVVVVVVVFVVVVLFVVFVCLFFVCLFVFVFVLLKKGKRENVNSLIFFSSSFDSLVYFVKLCSSLSDGLNNV